MSPRCAAATRAEGMAAALAASSCERQADRQNAVQAAAPANAQRVHPRAVNFESTFCMRRIAPEISSRLHLPAPFRRNSRCRRIPFRNPSAESSKQRFGEFARAPAGPIQPRAARSRLVASRPALIDAFGCLEAEKVPRRRRLCWQSLAGYYQRGGGRKKWGGENDSRTGIRPISADPRKTGSCGNNAVNPTKKRASTARTMPAGGIVGCAVRRGASAGCSLSELMATRTLPSGLYQLNLASIAKAAASRHNSAPSTVMRKCRFHRLSPMS